MTPAARRSGRLLLLGLVCELGVILYPPMRITLPNGDNPIMAARHFFLFEQIGPGWVIDAGRLLAEVLLVAVCTLLAVALWAWWGTHAPGSLKETLKDLGKP